jgi:glutamate-ammonia-ligase adenylyltransferase
MPELADRINAEIRAILCQPRDAEALRGDVSTMRQRMAVSHVATSPWQLKHWRGGLVDAEFIVQFLQLKHACEHPDVIEANTVLACGKLAAVGALDEVDATVLADAVRLFRNIQGLLRLTVDDAFDPLSAPESLKARLIQVGGEVDFTALEAKIIETGGRVTELFERIVDTPVR